MNIFCYKIVIFILSIFFIVSCKSADSDLDVINGSIVEEKYYPTVVKIFNANKKFECTGVIVSENVVLTAAHCVTGDIFINRNTNEVESIEVLNKYVFVNNSFIESAEVVVLPQLAAVKLKVNNLYKQKMKTDDDYEDGIISRSEYESLIKKIKEQMMVYPSLDLAAIIVKNNYWGWGSSPFKSVINEAKKRGKFFSLSKNSFPNNTVLNNDKRSVFFLGYGRIHTYDNLDENTKENASGKKLQKGYNSMMYVEDRNEWSTPEPEKAVNVISEYIFDGSNSSHGDSGGPLIYNNQILGVSSSVYQYDCEGNKLAIDPVSDSFLGIDSKTGKKKTAEELDKDDCVRAIWYSSTTFTSITLGSKQLVAEYFIAEVNKKLLELKLLTNENNSIFSTLLKR